MFKANHSRPQVWADPHAEKLYELKRERLRNSTANGDQSRIFEVYGDVVNELTAAFTNAEILEHGVTGKFGATGTALHTAPPVNVLDICMAPGGFAKVILDRYNASRVCGLSLPTSQGGHPLIESQFSSLQDRFEIKYLDITMLAAEFGRTGVLSPFSNERPHLHIKFDLVIADGAVLESHERSQYRTKIVEGVRLRASELVIALRRIKPGGTLVMLLHHMNVWETVQILRDFQAFSTVQVKKPTTSHKASSSFYLIAENVKPTDPAALAFMQKWSATWREITLDFDREATVGQPGDGVDAIQSTLAGLNIHSAQASDGEVYEFLEAFGPTLIAMGTHVWETQIEGLRGKTGKKAYGFPHEQPRRSTNEGKWGRGGRQGSLTGSIPGHQMGERRGSVKSDNSATTASWSSHDSEKNQAIHRNWNTKRDADLAQEAEARREREDARRASVARIQDIRGKRSWRLRGIGNDNEMDTAGLFERAGNIQAKK